MASGLSSASTPFLEDQERFDVIAGRFGRCLRITERSAAGELSCHGKGRARQGYGREREGIGERVQAGGITGNVQGRTELTRIVRLAARLHARARYAIMAAGLWRNRHAIGVQHNARGLGPGCRVPFFSASVPADLAALMQHPPLSPRAGTK